MFNMKTNALFLDDFTSTKAAKDTNIKLNEGNVLLIYSTSRIFKFSNEQSFCFVTRWFPSVSKCQDFLELDVKSVGKIIGSSQLNIDSEIIVFWAAYSWLIHRSESIVENRGNYKDYILSKVRLSFLSIPTIEYFETQKSILNINEDPRNILNDISNQKKLSLVNKSATNTRYCDHKTFKIIICGGINLSTSDVVSTVYDIDANNLHHVNMLPQMKNRRQTFEMVCINGEAYVFGGIDDVTHNCKPILSVEKYSPINNEWNIISNMVDNRTSFCVCSFLNSAYIIGGIITQGINSCLKFDTANLTWSEIAEIKEPRFDASCTVYEGKTVVTGGFARHGKLKSVEVYDHMTGSWSYMSSMVEGRCHHHTVAIRDKLFVVGGASNKTTLEVFDSSSKRFSILKPKVSYYRFYFPESVILVGSKLLVFEGSKILSYDMDKDQWAEESSKTINDLSNYSCVKIPLL